jgi:pyruvate/2-oxoglutarate dehydrogenase complex dihydrolipoamide acyltransferase (E2) component
LPLFKLKKNAFGSIMLTSIGSLGITKAFCPIAPYTKIPMVVSIGKIESKPIVNNQKIEIKKVLSLGFTFDHRVMDGMHFSEFFSTLNTFFNNPKSIDNE